MLEGFFLVAEIDLVGEVGLTLDCGGLSCSHRPGHQVNGAALRQPRSFAIEQVVGDLRGVRVLPLFERCGLFLSLHP